MKLFDQLFIQDRQIIAISILMICVAICLVSFSVYRFLRDRKSADTKISTCSKILDYVAPSLIALVMIIAGAYQMSFTTLHQQVSKSIDLDYFNLAAVVHVKSGEDVRYRFEVSSNEYSSTNNYLMKGINEVIGRYDFESIESIEEIATNQWEITFKCDCGKIKSVVVTD